jgi:phosphatidylglycerol:prolipoprotein diacylglycerol transferase
MYALALALGATSVLPYDWFHAGSIGPIQAFGIVVAVGVLIGAGVLRRYAEWHGVSDDHIRGITGWVTVTGFIGAHIFDVLFYQWTKLQEDPLLIVKLWEGISSYGGFLGGAFGWWFYVWWKRLDMRLLADVTILGLLVAFSIGRLGCTIVSDHVGAAVDPNAWYAALAVDYPRNVGGLGEHYTELAGKTIPAWNLGMLEFLYLVPVNLFLLWYAFRRATPDGTDKNGIEKWQGRTNAGMITALAGMFYAPVRFLLDYLRVNPEADPRYLSLTFAQWISILAFGASIALVVKIAKNGKPAEPVGATAGDVQRKLKMILKEDEAEKAKADAEPKADAKKEAANARKGDGIDDDELAKEAEAAGDDEGEEDEEEEEKPASGSAANKPAGNRPRPGGGSSKKKKKKRR